MKPKRVVFVKERIIQDKYELVIPDDLADLVDEDELQRMHDNPYLYMHRFMEISDPVQYDIEIDGENIFHGEYDID